LQRQAGLEDVPRLVALLEDPEFFVREAAAWPLSDLGVTSVLPQLLRAAVRGEREGLDNDGMNAALIDLVQAHPIEARTELAALAGGGDAELRDIAVWLAQFCDK
jgi:hypothetical protein